MFLYFIVPRTELIGDPDRYVKAGSTVVLHCVVRGALEPPSYIIWYVDNFTNDLWNLKSNHKLSVLSKSKKSRYHDAHQLLSDNQQKWKIKLDRGMPDSDGDIPNVVSFTFSFFFVYILFTTS